jgi:hypothetical protein
VAQAQEAAVIRKLFLAAAFAAALPAAAQEPSQFASPRWGSFEFSLGGYRPNIDSEFGGTGPFSAEFGGKRALMFRTDFTYTLFASYGSIDVGIGAGYTQKTGKGQLLDGSASKDDTSLKVIPTRLTLTYRFDVLANRHRWFPLTPYARISLDRYNWWVTNGLGNTAKAGDRSGRGATNGYSFSGGVAFLLDAIDPLLAREMDRDTGINHTYVFVDFTKSYVKDFGSASSWNLSDDRVTISGGLLFVF